uniref:(northern house mosquito) hypothetical protein n=1 Tax=Culex pipiens TaxID=7175 RepID=A0A8D8BWC7_CULPI
MILATDNLEEAIFAPSLIPRVGTQPVLDSVLNAPSNNSNRVTTFVCTRNLSIHSAPVLEEIAIHIKGRNNRTVLIDLGFHRIFVSPWENVRTGSILEVLAVGQRISGLALAIAFQNDVHVLGSAAKRVWLTTLPRIVRSPAGEAVLHPVIKSFEHVASVTLVTVRTAGQVAR